MLAHAEHAELQRLVLLLGRALCQQEPCLYILDGKRKHCHDIVVISAGILELHIELVAKVTLLGILIVELVIFLIQVIDFLADLLDVVHDLLGGYHVQHILKLEIHIHDSLRLLGINQRKKHVQEIILPVERNLCDKLVRDVGRFFQRVQHVLRVGVKEGIYDRLKLVEELVKVPDKELTVDFLYRVIVKALKVLGIPNHGEEIELLRIDLLKKHGSVCLCDYFHRFSSFLMCVILCSDSYTGGQKD